VWTVRTVQQQQCNAFLFFLLLLSAPFVQLSQLAAGDRVARSWALAFSIAARTSGTGRCTREFLPSCHATLYRSGRRPALIDMYHDKANTWYILHSYDGRIYAWLEVAKITRNNGVEFVAALTNATREVSEAARWVIYVIPCGNKNIYDDLAIDTHGARRTSYHQ